MWHLPYLSPYNLLLILFLTTALTLFLTAALRRALAIDHLTYLLLQFLRRWCVPKLLPIVLQPHLSNPSPQLPLLLLCESLLSVPDPERTDRLIKIKDRCLTLLFNLLTFILRVVKGVSGRIDNYKDMGSGWLSAGWRGLWEKAV